VREDFDTTCGGGEESTGLKTPPFVLSVVFCWANEKMEIKMNKADIDIVRQIFISQNY